MAYQLGFSDSLSKCLTIDPDDVQSCCYDKNSSSYLIISVKNTGPET